MENYKKTFYTKKFSNDFNFGIIQGKKAHWFILQFSCTTNTLFFFTGYDLSFLLYANKKTI